MNTTQERFLHSLKLGTGDAYLIARDNPDIDFSSVIKNGIIKNYAYDGQAEPSRAQYIYDILTISKSKEKLFPFVLDALENAEDQSWDLTHLFDLVLLYALDDYEGAKQAIYNKYKKTSDWFGAEEIIILDKTKGMEFIAGFLGMLLIQNQDYSVDEQELSIYEGLFPAIDIKKHLKNLAKKNQNIKKYVEALEKNNDLSEQNPTKMMKYNNVIEEVEASKVIPFRLRKGLKDDDLKLLAKRLETENDEMMIQKILFIFGYYKYPNSEAVILNMAQNMNFENKTRTRAIHALKYFQSDDIRQYLMKNLNNELVGFLDLFIMNYCEGDEKILIDLIEKENDEGLIESLAVSYIEIYRQNRTINCKKVFEILYNKMTCGIHRSELIKLMAEYNLLSEKIKNEIKHDSYDETRIFAESLLS